MHDLHSIHTSTVLLKARYNFYPIINNSFFLLLAIKPLQTKRIFQLCTFPTEPPQQAPNSLWLSPSCSATFYLDSLVEGAVSQHMEVPISQTLQLCNSTFWILFAFLLLPLLEASRYQRIHFISLCASLQVTLIPRTAGDLIQQPCF